MTNIKHKRVRVKLSSFDHKSLDSSIETICAIIQRTGSIIRGPIPMKKRTTKFTLLRSPHINKKANDQYEQTSYKRLLDIVEPNNDTITALTKLEISTGVDVKIIVK